MAETPRKKFNPVLVLVPVAVMAALVLAWTLPPSHALLANGPLKPLLARFTPPHSGPATGHAQTPDPALEVKRLSEQLDAQKHSAVEKDARIAGLQSQVDGLQAAPKVTPAPHVTSPPPVSGDIKRVGAYWAAMDADKAAEIARRLPPQYVGRVFATMPEDAVAEIMSALPAKTAAALTPGADAVAR